VAGFMWLDLMQLDARYSGWVLATSFAVTKLTGHILEIKAMLTHVCGAAVGGAPDLSLVYCNFTHTSADVACRQRQP
jgi:hypothetical protein